MRSSLGNPVEMPERIHEGILGKLYESQDESLEEPRKGKRTWWDG